MSWAIGLVFGIFMLDNGEVSWSMWVLILWTSYSFPSLLCIQNYKMSIFTKLPFVVHLFIHCNISKYSNAPFPLIYRSLTMSNGQTCPLAIYPKLCITFGCSNWGITTLVCTQQCLMIMFEPSNNLHCIENSCKGVQLVMDLIRINCCWGGPNILLILLD